MNRIVYVGADGNIFTINPDGSDSKRLTGTTTARSMGGILAQPASDDSVLLTWPTWSPDGSKIALSRAILTGAEPQVSLLSIDHETRAIDTIYQNEPGANTVIASSVPHYMYWSPDSEKLAFIAPTTTALVLFVNDGTETSVVSSEGPLYFNWAADSRSMIVHSRDNLSRVAAPFDGPATDLGPMDPIFRVPDLSPDGQTVAYVAGADDGYALHLGKPDGSEPVRQILSVETPTAILWSPVGDLIAVADGSHPRAPGYRQLRLVNPDGGEPVTLFEDSFAAFYWSPDGTHIAYVAINRETRRLVWKIAPTDGGEPWPLTGFIPSQGTLAAMSFFDQYAHSHSFWSPDGKSLVFAGQTGRGIEETNGSGPDQGSVYVLNIEPGSLPRRIAGGTLAFWSWN